MFDVFLLFVLFGFVWSVSGACRTELPFYVCIRLFLCFGYVFSLFLSVPGACRTGLLVSRSPMFLRFVVVFCFVLFCLFVFFSFAFFFQCVFCRCLFVWFRCVSLFMVASCCLMFFLFDFVCLSVPVHAARNC